MSSPFSIFIRLLPLLLPKLLEQTNGKRLIVFFHGYPAAGKTFLIRSLVRMMAFYELDAIVIDPDDRHLISKGEVPPEVGRQAMRRALLSFMRALVLPSKRPIVVADAGDNQGMRDSMIYMALIFCKIWNRLAPYLGLCKYEVHIHVIKAATPEFAAFCRNALRDRHVDPTLFADALEGVDRTFEAMKEICDTYEVVENGLSPRLQRVAEQLAWEQVQQARRCVQPVQLATPAFGVLRCGQFTMSSSDLLCGQHKARLARRQLRYGS